MSYKQLAIPDGDLKVYQGSLCQWSQSIPIIIPCPRIIGSDGSLTGFAHGLGIQKKITRAGKPFEI
ncbi:MAG: MGMT family protein [Saprospiraceae bacterium]|nr:MGMT family protein [Saprospiraceae bacterium]